MVEGIEQAFVLGQVGHDAQFDLRVVRRHQLVALGRDEGLADTPPLGSADRDVLQVRVAGGQAASGGHRLVIAGVDAPGARVDLLRQLVGVGALELAQAAVLHQHLGQLEVLLGQLGQYRLGGGGLALGGLADHRVTELFIEDHAQLLGRGQVEFLTGDLERLALQLHQFLAQLDALLTEQFGVDQRAVALDARQHRHQRDLDFAQHLGQGGHGFEASPKLLMQTQGHVGIFGGVGAGLLQSDLVEGQLLGALAGDVLEANGAVVQVLQRQAVHVVTGGGGIQHVGFEHGVEGHALHRDRCAGVGQNVDVVLGMLTDLGLGRVFEDRLQRLEHCIAIQLLRHAHVGVRQRDIGRFAGLDREGQADQLRLLRIDAGGLAVEGDQLGLLQLLQPGVELRLLQYQLVITVAGWRWLGGFLNGFPCRLGKQIASRRCSLGRQRLVLPQQVVQPVLELQLAVQLDQRSLIRLARMQRVDLDIQRYVGLDGRQLIGQVSHLAMLFELGRQALGAANRQLGHLVEVGIDHVEATADTNQQAERGFFTHTGHAGNVVDLVAHQRQVIDDQLRPDTEFLFHAIGVVDASGHGVDQRNVRADQLRHVLVAGGDDHVALFPGRLTRQSTDHVIGLHAFDAQQRQAEGTHAGMQRLDLDAQLVRHGRTIGLVLGEQLIAEGAALGVEDHGKRAVRVLLAQALEHVQHALDRSGGHAPGGGQRRQGVEGAV